MCSRLLSWDEGEFINAFEEYSRTRSDSYLTSNVTKVTQWGTLAPDATATRLRFPRKAAFFTLVAAEAMTRCHCVNAVERASRLYLAASHLYSRNGNVFEHRDDSETRYGWASLRVATVQGLPSESAACEAEDTGKDFCCRWAVFASI